MQVRGRGGLLRLLFKLEPDVQGRTHRGRRCEARVGQQYEVPSAAVDTGATTRERLAQVALISDCARGLQVTAEVVLTRSSWRGIGRGDSAPARQRSLVGRFETPGLSLFRDRSA